ncbi:ATP synthase F0 subunit B [Desulfococcaceae bacterium HSG8]|nr:ATP synthase F0 subunit B [Desulfococcaceae bacterium HSG8]
MDIVTNIALVSINETLFIQLISFLLFVFIMNHLMFRPLREVMNERDEYVREVEAGIVDVEKELENVTRLAKEKASAIKTEAFRIKDELEEAGSQEASEILDVTRKEIETLKTNTEKDIEVRVTEARKFFTTESETLAVSIMEKILERRLT